MSEMKTNLDKFFKTDSEVEKQGVWMDIDDNTGFLVKRWNDSNPQMKAAFAAHYKPYARQIEMGTLSPAKEREIMTKIFVNSCLIDWKGVEINGVATPFSKEAAVDFLINLPALFDALMEHAKDFKNFKVDDAKEDVGNS